MSTSTPLSTQDNSSPLSSEELLLLCTALGFRPKTRDHKLQQPHQFLISLLDERDRIGSIPSHLSHLILSNTSASLPMVKGTPTQDKLIPIFTTILEKLAKIDHSTQENLINNSSYFPSYHSNSNKPPVDKNVDATCATKTGTSCPDNSIKTPSLTHRQINILDDIWSKHSTEYRPAPSVADMHTLRNNGVNSKQVQQYFKKRNDQRDRKKRNLVNAFSINQRMHMLDAAANIAPAYRFTPAAPGFPFNNNFQFKASNFPSSAPLSNQRGSRSVCCCFSRGYQCVDNFQSLEQGSYCQNVNSIENENNIIHVKECTSMNCSNPGDCGNRYKYNDGILRHYFSATVVCKQFEDRDVKDCYGVKVRENEFIPEWSVLGEYTVPFLLGLPARSHLHL